MSEAGYTLSGEALDRISQAVRLVEDTPRFPGTFWRAPPGLGTCVAIVVVDSANAPQNGMYRGRFVTCVIPPGEGGVMFRNSDQECLVWAVGETTPHPRGLEVGRLMIGVLVGTHDGFDGTYVPRPVFAVMEHYYLPLLFHASMAGIQEPGGLLEWTVNNANVTYPWMDKVAIIVGPQLSPNTGLTGGTKIFFPIAGVYRVEFALTWAAYKNTFSIGFTPDDLTSLRDSVVQEFQALESSWIRIDVIQKSAGGAFRRQFADRKWVNAQSHNFGIVVGAGEGDYLEAFADGAVLKGNYPGPITSEVSFPVRPFEAEVTATRIFGGRQ